MKKSYYLTPFIIFLLSLMVFVFYYKSELKSNSPVHPQPAATVHSQNETPSEYTYVQAVDREEFSQMAKFIEGHGRPFVHKITDGRYDFKDSEGNLNIMAAIKRAVIGGPAIKDSVVQISVWAYYQGIKDDNHFYGYIIYPDKVTLAYNDQDSTRHIQIIKKTYQEFLARAKRG